MFEPTSRYYNLETRTHERPGRRPDGRPDGRPGGRRPDGRAVTYVRRRFLPPGRTLPELAEVTVTEGDRLDRITARTLGAPEAFWQVADANDAMHPADLTAVPGRRLRVPLPRPTF